MSRPTTCFICVEYITHKGEQPNIYVTAIGNAITPGQIEDAMESFEDYEPEGGFLGDTVLQVIFREHRCIDGGGALLDVEWLPDLPRVLPL